MKTYFLRAGIGIIIGMIGACGVVSEASAATYYVDKHSSVTSDNNSGTKNRPWRTLAKACRSIRPGDTVIVRAGHYPERMNFYHGNLKGGKARTTFRAEPGVTFYGADTIYAPNLTIAGFIVTMPESVIQSDWTARYAFFIRSSGVQIVRNYVRDFPGVGVQGYWVHPWPADVVIRNNTFRRCNQGVVVHGQDWTVDENEIDQLVRWTLDCDYIRFFGNRIKIRRNFLHGTRLSDVGISHVDGFQTFPNNGWHATNVTIVGNYVESFHQGAMIGVPQHAQMSGYIWGIRFYNNVFVGGEIGGSWGIQTMDAQYTQIQYNLFINMKSNGAAVGLREYSSGHVRNNIFYNTGQNYYKDSTSTMYGGFNILNREPKYPLYRHSGDFVGDPQLVNPWNLLGPDGRPRTADDGFRLRSTSPARDRASFLTLPVDMYFGLRSTGLKPDVGPHEYAGTAMRSVEAMAGAADPELLTESEAIEILLVSSEPIDTTSIWADTPVSIQNLVRVEWVADEEEPNGVWVRIIPIGSWDRIADAGALVGKPFSVNAGNADLSSGKHLFIVGDA